MPSLPLAVAVVLSAFLPSLLAWARQRSVLLSTLSQPLFRDLLLTAGMLFLLAAERIPYASLGLAPVPWGRLLGTIALSVGVVVGIDIASLNLAILRIGRAAPSGWAAVESSARLPMGRDRLAFLPLCVVSALWEEFCFRGVLFSLFPAGAAGAVAGVLASSALFAVHHWNGGKPAMAYSGLYGALFSILYLSTGSLPATMIAHLSGNLFVLFYAGPRLRRAAAIVLAPLGI